jgi:hypothetical protein
MTGIDIECIMIIGAILLYSIRLYEAHIKREQDKIDIEKAKVIVMDKMVTHHELPEKR